VTVDKGLGFHLDYCFLPEPWANRITNVEVGLHSDWNDISDHVPLIVDLALSNPTT
jgi:endonuclease/exonuclease/phosphatase family metal-dependent hydrolase